MNKFTSFSSIVAINEAKRLVSNVIMTIDELNEYLQKVGKKIPKQVADILYLTIKYKLVDQKTIDTIRDANKGQLKTIAFNYNIPETEIEDIWKSLKELKTNLRLLPQYQTTSERHAFMAGKLKMTDITIDLETSAGKNAAAKLYMPMIYKIVNQYLGKSRLSKADLMSAAQEGFVDAMADWRKKEDGNDVPFKTYASYRVRFAINAEINKLTSGLSGVNWYSRQKMGNSLLAGISLDGAINDEGEFKQDYLASLGADPNIDLTPDEERSWEKLYKIIDNTFKQRDSDIFYRYFGLKNYNKEKSKDIARSLGMSPGGIKPIIDKILKTLVKSPDAYEILQDLQSAYNESLMIELINLEKGMVLEYIMNDDMFILLEELTKWVDKNVFKNALYSSLEMLEGEATIIEDILAKDFDYLDKKFKSNKKLIIKFLGLMYPTENFSRKTDVSLLEYMSEFADLYKKYCK